MYFPFFLFFFFELFFSCFPLSLSLLPFPFFLFPFPRDEKKSWCTDERCTAVLFRPVMVVNVYAPDSSKSFEEHDSMFTDICNRKWASADGGRTFDGFRFHFETRILWRV